MRHPLLALALTLSLAGCASEPAPAPAKATTGLEPSRPRPVDPAPAPTPAPPKKDEPPIIKGGGDFDSATLLKPPCKFRVQLAGGSTAQFFKFDGKDGFATSLTVLCKDKLDFALHGADKAMLHSEFTDAGELTWLHEGGVKAPLYYLRTWPTMNYDHVAEFDLKLVDNTDAGSGRDAPAGFDNAPELPEKSFDGWLAGAQGYRGNDHNDVFHLKVSKGKAVKVRVTPPARMGVEVGWFDKDRGRAVLETSSGEGAVVTATWTPDYDGDAWLKIDGELQIGGKYKVEVNP